MKRFVTRFATFALLVFATVGGFCALELAAEIRAYRRELIAPSHATVFVCGDSRTEWSLNPEEWPNLFNFSVSGRPLDQTFLTALDILQANAGRFRTLLVDVSVETTNLDYDLPIGCMMGGAKQFLVYFLHRDETMRDYSGSLRLARDLMVDRRLRHIWKVIRGKTRFCSSLASGYNRIDLCLKQSSPERFARRLTEWTGERKHASYWDPSGRVRYFELLNRLLDMAQEFGVEVVLLTPPYHPDLIRTVGHENVRRFASVIRKYAQSRNCRYFDLSEKAYPDSFWTDEVHLNSKGAVAFSRDVRTLVEQNGGVPKERLSEERILR